ncbi:hypothetical protein BBK36DRAFT_1137337 [Trichoderma citrinoviride]|uniref:Uncharacterized protein n=1 Tax=Trichoderma citrinoviride TaxID=58853 RepID=A0A2T4BMY0_9HYPO|nr:hypothetical protein BBK36DRAFT_1137337 [Trichoderma citrinoviride]PTB70677.1 hypothetical protein BBK36DRAFT_1137337 [Trichoderma citrinoviride]
MSLVSALSGRKFRAATSDLRTQFRMIKYVLLILGVAVARCNTTTAYYLAGSGITQNEFAVHLPIIFAKDSSTPVTSMWHLYWYKSFVVFVEKRVWTPRELSSECDARAADFSYERESLGTQFEMPEIDNKTASVDHIDD